MQIVCGLFGVLKLSSKYKRLTYGGFRERFCSLSFRQTKRGCRYSATAFRGIWADGRKDTARCPFRNRYFRFLPLAATRWTAVTAFFGVLRTLLVALPLPLPFSSRPHAVPSSNFINADQSKPSFDILLKSGMSGWGWGLVFSFRRGDDVGSYAVSSCEGSACTVSSWAGAGAYAVGVAGTGVAGFTFRVGFFGAGAYVCPAAW